MNVYFDDERICIIFAGEQILIKVSRQKNRCKMIYIEVFPTSRSIRIPQMIPSMSLLPLIVTVVIALGLKQTNGENHTTAGKLVSKNYNQPYLKQLPIYEIL